MHIVRFSLFAALCAAACGGGQASSPSSSSKAPPPDLPVSMETARQTALARVPGQVKEEELEEEDGRWVYEFDITAAPGGPVQEVVVDATSGQVVSVEQDD